MKHIAKPIVIRLECCHGFCEGCISECVKPKEKEQVKCPRCGDVTALSMFGTSNLKTLDGLAIEVDSATSVSPKEKCINCHKEDHQPKFCDTCGGTLCEGCALTHTDDEINSSHVVRGNVLKCARHGLNITSVCLQCNVPMCLNCTNSDEHSVHPRAALDTEVSQRRSEIMTKLGHVKPAITSITIDFPKLEESLQQFEATGTQIFDKILEKVRSEKKEFERRVAEEKLKLSTEKASLLSIELYNKHLGKAKDYGERFSRHANDYIVVLYAKDLLQRVNMLAQETVVQNRTLFFNEHTVVKNIDLATKLLKIVVTNEPTFAYKHILEHPPLDLVYVNNMCVVSLDCESGLAVLSGEVVHKPDYKVFRIAASVTKKLAFTCATQLCVKELSVTDSKAPDVAWGQFEKPWALAQNSEGLWAVADDQKQKNTLEIVICEENGKPIQRFGSIGEGPTQFKLINYMRWLDNSRLIISDLLNKRVTIFTKQGDLVKLIDKHSCEKFGEPRGVCVTPSGTVLVCDSEFDCVNEFSDRGEFVRTIIRPGQDGLQKPYGIDISPDNKIISVSSKDNKTVISYNARF